MIKGKSKLELTQVLHKELVLIVTSNHCFAFVVESITRNILSVETAKNIENLILTKIEYEKTAVYIANNKFTLLPHALLIEDKARDYLSFTNNIKETDKVQVAHSLVTKIAYIWANENKLEDEIVALQRGAIFNHLGFSLLNSLTISEENVIKSIFLEKELLITLVVNGMVKQISLFEINSIEEALYYHLLLLQSSAVEEKEIQLEIFGIYNEKESFVSRVKDYFSNVKTTDNKKIESWKLGAEDLKNIIT